MTPFKNRKLSFFLSFFLSLKDVQQQTAACRSGLSVWNRLDQEETPES